jgi:eukaryotic-like serine/threonine-protein kinase
VGLALASNEFHAADPSLAGRTIGGCRLLHLLGVGGMGAVWKAHHLALDIPVALKLMLPLEALGPDAGERLLREARAAAKLRHPNIVGVFNVGEEDGVHFLVMEFVEGQSLQKILDQRGALPVDEALAMAEQLLAALELTFANHIVHRDIKPDNILVDGQGVAKLADLGLAKQVGSDPQLTQTGMVMGSPYYIAPEQASDTKNAGPLVDIYSSGCVLFHMLAGKPPFGGATQLEVVLNHIRAPIPDLAKVAPTVPPGLGPIVAKMMEKEPARRYQSPGEVRQALAALRTGGAVTPVSRARKWPRAVAVALPVVLVLGLANGLWRCGRAKPAPVVAPAPPATGVSLTTATETIAPEPAASKPQGRARRPTAPRVDPHVDPYQGDPAAAPPQTWSYQPTPRRGASGLSAAVQAGDRHSLRELLDRGTPPNVPDGQTSPLHQAVHLGDGEAVLMLLQKGANPNARNSAGETPLHEALRRHDHSMVSNLLDFGANPNLPDRYGLRPLQVAGYDDYLLRKLREKGAN